MPCYNAEFISSSCMENITLLTCKEPMVHDELYLVRTVVDALLQGKIYQFLVYG